MTYEEGDIVRLHDEHSEFDGEEGEITQVMETMFGDQNYTISFDDGQEAGIPADNLEPVEIDADTDIDTDTDTDADADDGDTASPEEASTED